jgi:hypothetical protein
MKRVIGGKLYDTATATEMAQAERFPASDFNHYREKLYKTKSGAYFLHGVGGPLSRWGYGDMMRWSRNCGEDIAPLTRDEALEWCETREIDADLVIGEFKIPEA